MKKKWITSSLVALVTAVAALSAGCNNQGFVPGNTRQNQVGAGFFFMPAKVDILLVEDDSTSFQDIFGSIQGQIPNFLSSLQSSGWDFHFAVIPLTTNRPVTQALASLYDSNWGSMWIPPFPGAIPGGPGTLDASVFRTPDHFGAFLTTADINQGLGGMEPGFQNIDTILRNGFGSTQFSRPDAPMVMIMMGNGNDTSGVNFCTRSDGTPVACEQIGNKPCGTAGAPPSPYCGTSQASFNQYLASFQNFATRTKGSARQFQFHAAVAANEMNNCLGSHSYQGARYQQMAFATGGAAYDICSTPVSDVLSRLQANLQAQRLQYQTRYLVVSTRPNVDTVVITRYAGGDTSQASVIPQDPVNGWTYANPYLNPNYSVSPADPVTVFTVDYPVPMNSESGFVFELHGRAKLLGNDSATVQYLPFGMGPSSN